MKNTITRFLPALACYGLSLTSLAHAAENVPLSATVQHITVQPDLAPDCTSLKSIAESVTRDCKTNDAKAIAIYNFMQLCHYHRQYPSEPGGIPVLKEFTNYGWSLCGGLHSEQSALWRQLGWGWRFVGWDGHTTVEAEYDGRWHYLDVFLKFYAWAPDGKGGRTIASQDELTADPDGLITNAFTLDQGRSAAYLTNSQFQMVNGKANWRAPSFLTCGDTIASIIAGLKTHHNNGSPEGWAGINHADGDYTADVNLAPGFALTNTWDPIEDAWYWPGQKTAPGHTCSGHKDTRNDPGIGLVLEPYFDAKKARSYGNGHLSFAPDFTKKSVLTSFVNVENVAYAKGAIVPQDASKPSSVVVQLASPYVMTKASGTISTAATVEVSTDAGTTYTPVEIKDFSAAVSGHLSALVKVTFTKPINEIRFDAVVQNNPGALPYLSPGSNVISVNVADPKSLGENSLVVTYAYRLGYRTKSFAQLCEQGKEIAKQHNATWSDTITYVQKTFRAQDLPATFTIDCPTPKGMHPVYPRMMLLRREIVAPGTTPRALPAGAQAIPAKQDGELMSLPNPFLVGTEQAPVQALRPMKTVDISLSYVQFSDVTGKASANGMLSWPKNPGENDRVLASAVVVTGDLAALSSKNIAAARLSIPILSGHTSAPAQLGVVMLTEPVAKGTPINFTTLPDVQGTGLVPQQPADIGKYQPAKIIDIDVTRSIRAIAAKESTFHGFAVRIVPNRSVDDGYTVRCDVSSVDPIVLHMDTYTDGP